MLYSRTRYYVVYIILSFCYLFANDTAYEDAEIFKLSFFIYNNIKYIDLIEFIDKHEMHSNYYEAKDKIEISYKKHKFYFSAENSYCKINEDIYHLTYPVINKNERFYIPAIPFYQSLEDAELPFRIIKYDTKTLYVTPSIYNINAIKIEQKQNGTLIQLQTLTPFKKQNISSSISSSNWLNITILKCYLDSLAIHSGYLTPAIKKVQTLQSKESAQISFLLKEKVEDIDIEIQPNSINFLLRHEVNNNATKINKLRKKWFIDTVVIDAGHGGKDPGAVGYKLKEKEITLDIAKKLGSMLTRNLGLSVVYTREEDVFIPLWKRTKIANQAEGKLFISIHVNSANKSPKTKGYETYLLRPGKTSQAIEVVERENSVIELEQKTHQYTDFSNENHIIASMAQNSFMKESEDLAAFIQKQMKLNLKNTTKNRGVKQAGFHVLVGATMPNVLVEVGFLSNKSEAQNLSKSYYKRQIAESIYNAIIDFKVKYEKPLLNHNE